MRILIADDHSLIREGLRKILLESLPFAEVHDVADSADLLKKRSAKNGILLSLILVCPAIQALKFSSK